MAFADLLCHTVEVYRRSARLSPPGDIDRFGQPEDANPSQMPDDQLVGTYRARLQPKSGGLTMEERSQDVFTKYRTLYTEMVDILEDDIVRVLDEGGAEMLPKSKVYSKDVATGYGAADHLEITLISQTGPG